MIVQNTSPAIIILPSRHKLPIGRSEVHPRVLSRKENAAFVARLIDMGKLVTADDDALPLPPVAAPVGEMTRRRLAEMRPDEVYAYAEALGHGRPDGSVDDVRVFLADEVFE